MAAAIAVMATARCVDLLPLVPSLFGAVERGGEEAGVGTEHQQPVGEPKLAVRWILPALLQVPESRHGVHAEEPGDGPGDRLVSRAHAVGRASF